MNILIVYAHPNHTSLNYAHKALMKKTLFGFVGIKNVKFFEFGSVEKSPEKQNKKLDKVHNYFSTLEF